MTDPGEKGNRSRSEEASEKRRNKLYNRSTSIDKKVREEIISEYDESKFSANARQFILSILISFIRTISLGFIKLDEYPLRDWRMRFKEIDSRLITYDSLFKIYDKNQYPFNKRIILIDVMLDKTQYELGKRSIYYFVPGFLLLILTILSLIAFVMYLNFSDILNCSGSKWLFTFLNKSYFSVFIDVIFDKFSLDAFYIACHPTSPKDWMEFVLVLFKRVVIGGALLAVVYVFFANSKACFRESTRLLHRRHSVRYIRLLLYNSSGNLDNSELREAFGIDDVTSSGFDDIRTEVVLNNLVGRLIDQIGRLKGGSGSKEPEAADVLKTLLKSVKER